MKSLRVCGVPHRFTRISYGNSVCPSVRLSVCHDPVPIQVQVR